MFSRTLHPPPQVGTWYVDSYETIGGTSNVLRPSWAFAQGASQSGGTTVVCFSRKWTATESRIAPVLPTETGELVVSKWRGQGQYVAWA